MPKSPINQPRMTLLLLQEAIWQVEDRVNVIAETIAEQESHLLRLRRLSDLHSRKLELFEDRLKVNRLGGSNHA